MSSVIDLRAYVNPSVVQTLVLVDLQQEYIAAPRVLALEETKGALANCRAALAHARAMGIPVAFARWIDRTPLFNKATRFSRWIEGFEPHGVDMIFERNRPSCYTSTDFAEVIGSGGGSFVLAGFAVKSATDLLHGPQGYDPDGLLVMRLVLPDRVYPDETAQRQRSESTRLNSSHRP